MVEWNEEERMLLEMVRKFTKQKLAPSAQQHEKDASFDRAHWNEMGDLGLTGLPVSAEFGGSGMSLSILRRGRRGSGERVKCLGCFLPGSLYSNVSYPTLRN